MEKAIISLDTRKMLFQKIIKKIETLIEGPHESDPLIAMNFEFNENLLSLQVSQSQGLFIKELISNLPSHQNYTEDSFIYRWILLNKILLDRFYRKCKDSQIYQNSLTLGALVAFPLIETLAHNLTRHWNEEGILIKDIPIDEGLTRVSSQGKVKSKKYKEGDRIVSLSHKLQLLENSLPIDLKLNLKELNHKFSTETPGSQLYQRIERHRDLYLHGRQFYGWESIFINLLIGYIYFGNSILKDEENYLKATL